MTDVFEAAESDLSKNDYMQDQKQTSKLAVASLVLGLLGAVLWLLTTIPAIVTGHMARGRARRSGGAVGGEGIALAGLILGYVMSVFGAIGFMVLIGVVMGTGSFFSLKGALETARTDVLLMELVIEDFNEDNGRLPALPKSDCVTSDESGRLLLSILAAEESGVQNERKKNYLTDVNDRISRGEDGKISGYLDPWGNPYRVVLKEGKGPSLEFTWGGEPVSQYGKRVAVGSKGIDGIEGTVDDIKSWD